jgi:hypothetical protein
MSRRALFGRRGWVTTLAVVGVSAPVLVAGGWLGVGGVGSPAAAQSQPASDGVALTEIEARVEAAASGRSVEVLAFRDERRDVVANPDGTMTVRQFTAPVRTVRDGGWVAVDPTLQVRPGGRVAPAAATVDMSFSGGGSSPLAEVEKAGRMVSLGWEGPLPAPALAGATATYAEVLPGVDLIVTALADGFSHTLVVKTATAAANPALAEIELPLSLDGAEVRETGSGGVEFVDAGSGGVMLAADAPMMWDSSSTVSGPSSATAAASVQRRAEVQVSVDDAAVTLVPDVSMLSGPGVAYPVYIDPVYRDESRSAWAMVDSGYPSEEYWKFDGADDEGLGRCPVSSGTCNNSQVKRLLYRMPTSFYDGKEILSAEFVAVLKHNWAGGNVSDQANLYLMSSGFSTSTNWNNQPSGSLIATASPPAPSGDCSGLDDGGVEWDVRPELQAAAGAGRSSVTFGLRNATESDSTKWMRFCHSAYLRIRYNTPPSQPKMDDLSISPGAGCAYDLSGDSYINRLPTLRAYLYDPDHGRTNEWNGGGTVAEQLRAEFRIMWGSGSTWTAPLTAAKSSGSRFTLDLATASGRPSLPNNAPIAWIVRAYDGHHYSPWSWSGTATQCRFVIDPTAPNPPTITSAEFPSDDTWTDKLGEYGSFTFSSTSTDVVSYKYDFTNDAAGPVTVPSAADRTATVSFMPSRVGPHVLTVQAFDNASNSSINSYDFAVSARPEVGGWTLADPAGSTQAGNVTGTNTAVAGSGVTFGVPGPGANTAARFDGGSGAWLQAPARGLVNTSDGFAATAWVRVTDLSRYQTAVSVDGTGEAGFSLGYHASSQRWSLDIPDLDMYRFRTWQALSPAGSVEAGEWTHLAAVYDPGTAAMRLYVNGTLTATATRRSSWPGMGAIQIGRSYVEGRYRRQWEGDLAEVRVFDRVVFPEEIAQLATLAPQRQAYWQLNDAENGTSPEYTGGPALTLAGGASIYQQADPVLDPQPLVGAGHLALDGIDDYASASAPVVNTGDSFTVTARVRLSSAQPAEPMTVISVSGMNTSMFKVRYSADDLSWQLVVALSDAAAPQTVSVLSPVDPSSEGKGQLIAAVYNAFTDQLILYVDGQASAPVALSSPWAATGGLQVGRSRTFGTYEEHLSGVVDEVRVYAGVADAATVQRIGDFAEQPEL